MLITFRGRRSGRSLTTPVSYLREDATVRCFSSLETRWWKNLRGGAPVTVRIAGEDRPGRAEVVADEPKRIADTLEAFLAQLPRDAPYYASTLDSDGKPRPEDLERAARQVVLVEIALDPPR